MVRKQSPVSICSVAFRLVIELCRRHLRIGRPVSLYYIILDFILLKFGLFSVCVAMEAITGHDNYTLSLHYVPKKLLLLLVKSAFTGHERIFPCFVPQLVSLRKL